MGEGKSEMRREGRGDVKGRKEGGGEKYQNHEPNT
jgi:hypothetical protein